ncbi:hypothetical protein G6F61_011890 [Rhizopus arrhizus]|nr:hypothetical protein G6F61_011890 [Rhizopus arrhizus]
MTWLQQNKVQYINDWSPNSPDLNPIEHVWHLLKLRLSLYERKARNIYELWERVDVEWNKLDKDVCRSYIDSMPDRIAAVTIYRHGLDVVVPIFSPSVHTTPMGITEDRRICSSSQPSVTNVLDSIPRSISISNRCNETNMVTKGDVSVSTLEVNSASVKENSGTEIEASSSNHSMVAQPILVSNDSKNETHPTSNNWKINQKWSLAAWQLSTTIGYKMA